MTHPNVELLRRGLAAFSAGDAAALAETFAPDAVYVVPGKSLLAGRHVGPEAIVSMLRRAGELSGGTYRVEPQYMLADDDHVHLYYRARGERGERSIDIDQVLICGIAGGRIAEVLAVPTDQAAFDEFWS